jgi:biopolymer transport protein ExbD
MKTLIQFEKDKHPRPIGLQVAPMVDIVLLLVCFFMLTSQLVQSHKDPTVMLPWMKNPLSAPETRSELIVNLRADGGITVNGQAVAPASLTGFVGGEFRRAQSEGRPLRVVVRADRRQRFAALDDCLAACRKAGLGQVVFRTQEDQP